MEHTTSTVGQPADPSPPFQTREEARLFMYYVHNLSTWVDICDKRSFFGTEVTRRACRIPLLAYTILAFTAQHMALTSSSRKQGWTDSAIYYGRAVGLLIPELNGPIEKLDENVLASIVLLRNYEEHAGRPGGDKKSPTRPADADQPMLDAAEGGIDASLAALTGYRDDADMDMATHLLGSSRLLNSVSSFVESGGGAEAASWIVLRQDMFVSLTKAQPLHINLDSFRSSRSFIEDDAGSIANRAVFLCSEILANVYGQPGVDIGSGGDEWWDRLNADVAAWWDHKPWHFGPMWAERANRTKRVSGAATAPFTAFPNVWMVRPAYILGYQHYYLARLLLVIFNPNMWTPKPGFEDFRKRQEADVSRNLSEPALSLINELTAFMQSIVLESLRMIIGLSTSNLKVISSRFMASHTLQTCGSYLTDPHEREEALRFLENMETDVGWRTRHVIDKLKSEWSHNNTAPFVV